MRLTFILLLINSLLSFSQTQTDSVITNSFKPNSFFVPNTQSTHPLGLYISRINHNFQLCPAKKASIVFSYSSGNVWQPYVKAYIPTDNDDINRLKEIPWHERYAYFDTENKPAETIEFNSDGVFRVYRLALNHPINIHHEVGISLRAFSVDVGKMPYSIITSDHLIEWFHTNIHGGEDPFSRKYYGMDRVELNYTDENGNSFNLEEGDMVLPGIEFSYHFYPDINYLKSRNLFLNLGSQLGFNVSTVNPSVDLGINAALVKTIKMRKNRELYYGLSLGALRQRIIENGKGVLISNNKFLFSSDIIFNYRVQISTKSYLTLGTIYSVQTAYRDKNVTEYYVINGDRHSTHWHYALTSLYTPLTEHSLFFTYSRQVINISIYIREDLLVHNTPDVQTGIELKFDL